MKKKYIFILLITTAISLFIILKDLTKPMLFDIFDTENKEKEYL